jgi:hypothetical protein
MAPVEVNLNWLTKHLTKWHYDEWPNDTQHYDTQHKSKKKRINQMLYFCHYEMCRYAKHHGADRNT